MKRWLTIFAVLVAVTGCSDDETTPPEGGACDVCDAPSESDAIFEFLTSGDYTGWDKESAAHASTGPHGNPVLVYLSPVLSASLAAGNASHDRGSAVVKEFLADDMTTVEGWAAWVKIEADSAGGDNIYWYENFSATNNSPVADSLGAGGCSGCHSGGTDYLLIPYPLQ